MINFGQGAARKTFRSVQFHFHTPSEHSFNGRLYDAELHIVHQSPDKQYAVYGLLLQVKPNVASDFLSGLNPSSLGTSNVKLPVINTPSTVYHYKGSLTTPSCNEGVQWFVNPEPVPISSKSLASLKRLLNHGHPSNRKIMPLNGRRVINAGTSCKLTTR